MLQAFLLFPEEMSCLDFGPKSGVLELLDGSVNQLLRLMVGPKDLEVVIPK